MIFPIYQSARAWSTMCVAQLMEHQLAQVLAFFEGDREQLIADFEPIVAACILSAPEEAWTS